MDTYLQLARQRQQILDRIAALGPMRPGSITEQHLPTRRADGSLYRRGPYLTYTFKHKGKTRGKHLRQGPQADLYQRQIEAFRRWQELSAELVGVSQRLADLEAADQSTDQKKTSRR
jgi:hypothetical protein